MLLPWTSPRTKMRRYRRLTKEEIYEALNKVRDAFLAAKDGNEVHEIINSILTTEEKLKIGRRVLVAEYLKVDSLTMRDICNMLKVGRSTLQFVSRRIALHPKGFELIKIRSKRVENEYQKKKLREVGGSQLVFKRKEYTEFKRKDVKR
ncbi:MAG: hypothetical protein A3C27_01765 [Candidatus Levybacteria bacterium RIFCSPHIGHO2_02_FULL_39_36]|nr:MAG: hypothetical protein UT20_C0007G0039 [Candidatus Levybacteria bacterium GW2011_GWA1_39_11]KKR24742.1 MAG: hypothetical protein UT56_C0009G0007 [Candidatus Levybacteria bacterium GW2011_GWB1_39_7]KKR25952.1 MAG: hypothetical protein UT58_C0028G0006 [Microgenomates group bacterium GW2011_GWC1_39_7b]OGH14410.1 MAG: hypothetical protein A2689_02705 [Candidatus Levybacteria bacterium RIFCSPHIGHO2_01_FULL_38_96]OGH28424.1 MAG: hypothetical protein A3C27_01765 [Candidatus Levybacteria bacteriu